MQVLAYIANQFPSPLEPYVAEEIQALRQRGVHVVPCSARLPEANLNNGLKSLADETLHLQHWKLTSVLLASWLCLVTLPLIADFLWRILAQGNETAARRAKALLHTWMGVYLAISLREKNVTHIHVHHGYFSAWITMVAARVLKIGFSMTLHGSDLLLKPFYLDTKLENCDRCYTVSDFNRKFIIGNYPQIESEKIVLRRLGVKARAANPSRTNARASNRLRLLSVGRLHPVKDHAFLLAACRELKASHVAFNCFIAGEGPARPSLEWLVHQFRLEEEVQLLGHLSRPQLDEQYAICDIAALTSRSEGIPVALMEAMAHEKIVLAPDITGIHELIVQGKTGSLYQPGSLADFVSKVEMIHSASAHLEPIRARARNHVAENFNSDKNLAAFVDRFLFHLGDAAASTESGQSENPLLQQI